MPQKMTVSDKDNRKCQKITAWRKQGEPGETYTDCDSTAVALFQYKYPDKNINVEELYCMKHIIETINWLIGPEPRSLIRHVVTVYEGK